VTECCTGTVNEKLWYAFVNPPAIRFFQGITQVSEFERIIAKHLTDFGVLLQHALPDSQNVIFGRIHFSQHLLSHSRQEPSLFFMMRNIRLP
jgi:hypothetical protein